MRPFSEVYKGLGLKEEIQKRKSAKRLLEQKENLKQLIGREAANAATRIASSEDDERKNLDSAMTLFTQALVLADTNSRESRRLFNIAKRLSRKK